MSESNPSGEITPIFYFPAHDSCIRDVQFGRHQHHEEESPYQLISCGNDGRLMFWDLNDLFSPHMMFRTRGAFYLTILFFNSSFTHNSSAMPAYMD